MVRYLKWLLPVLSAALWFLLDHYILKGTGNPVLLIIYPLLTLWVLLPQRKESFIKKRIILVIMTLLAAMMILEVLMIPYKAYQVWFNLLAENSAQGRISRLFSKLALWISTLLILIPILRKKLDGSLVFLPFFLLFLLLPHILTGLLCFSFYLLPRYKQLKRKSFPLIILISLIIGLTGLKTEPKGVQWVDNFSSQLYNKFINRFPEIPLLYQVPLFGQSLSDSIDDGSKPVLSERSLLLLQGPPEKWVYLRTGLYDHYSAHGILKQSYRSITRKELQIAPETNEETLRVTLLSDFLNILPVTLDTVVIKSDRGNFLWSDYHQTLHWDFPPLLYNESYSLVEDYSLDLLDNGDLAFYSKAPPVSEEIENLAQELKGNDHLATAYNIQRYFLKDFSYTLETEGRKDFIEHFLTESKKGFCLHFASSFVLLARLNGIPCRMAEGYIAYLPGAEAFQDGGIPGETLISGYSAHTWPEVYIQDRGWITLEVTPPYYHEDNRNPDQRDFTQSNQSDNNEVQSDRNQGIKIPILPPVMTLLFLLLMFFITLLYRKYRVEIHLFLLIRKGKKRPLGDPRKYGWKSWAGKNPERIALLPQILKYRYGLKKLNTQDEKKLIREIRQLVSLKNLS